MRLRRPNSSTNTAMGRPFEDDKKDSYEEAGGPAQRYLHAQQQNAYLQADDDEESVLEDLRAVTGFIISVSDSGGGREYAHISKGERHTVMVNKLERR
jgi:hypothetical protein